MGCAMCDYTMTSITPYQYRHCIYKDECGDELFLTKYGEIYRHDENTIRIGFLFIPKPALNASKKFLSHVFSSDDSIHTYETKVANFPEIINWGYIHKKRPHLNGKWMNSMRERLAHDLIPYKPHLTKFHNWMSVSGADLQKEEIA